MPKGFFVVYVGGMRDGFPGGFHGESRNFSFHKKERNYYYHRQKTQHVWRCKNSEVSALGDVRRIVCVESATMIYLSATRRSCLGAPPLLLVRTLLSQ